MSSCMAGDGRCWDVEVEGENGKLCGSKVGLAALLVYSQQLPIA